MKKLLLLPLATAFILLACTQKQSTSSSKNNTSDVILEINNKKITSDDFVYVYTKNHKNLDKQFQQSDLEQYMQLYLNFQLKIAEAEKQGLDTLPSFLKEFGDYQKKLAKPYLSDETYLETWAKKAYQRQKEEVNVSHLLIKSGQSPEDTLRAYNKILTLKQEIEDGADFGQYAIKYSEDPSAQMENYPLGYKGNLGYFSAFDMVFEFENAAYENPVGNLVGPIKTQFGYHLLKIHDRRPSQAQRDVSHIMILAANNINTEDSAKAAEKIYELRKQVTLENWNELCAKHSEHEKTKNQNGNLGYIKIGGSLGSPEFEKAAFSLEINEISQPIKSAYGWHIIKLNAIQKQQTYEDQKKELIQKVSKIPTITEMGKKQFINGLKDKYHFKENPKHFSQAKTLIESASWKEEKNKSSLDLTLFEINSNTYTIGNFTAYLEKNHSSKTLTSISPEKEYENYKIQSLYAYAESELANEQPAYRHLVQEYRDGILLFDLMNKAIWKKAINDTTELHTFFKNNQQNYRWNTRMKTAIHHLYDRSKTQELLNLLQQGKTVTEHDFNKNAALTLKIETKTLEQGINDQELKGIIWETGIQQLLGTSYPIVLSKTEILPAMNKELSECKGQVISDYQNYLEKTWIDELKKTHTYTIHQNVLKKLAKN